MKIKKAIEKLIYSVVVPQCSKCPFASGRMVADPCPCFKCNSFSAYLYRMGKELKGLANSAKHNSSDT